MTNTIEHQGIVENINGSHLRVRIIQTSACAACSVKGHCTSADSKEKLIDIVNTTGVYNVGDQVTIVGATSMGMQAVLLAFIIPFILLVGSLFIFMAWLGNDLHAALLALAVLVPYYYILWRNKDRLARTFSFSLKA